MKLALVTSALLLSVVACSSAPSTVVKGDEQNQTESQWNVSSIAAGPSPFDRAGSYRVAAVRDSDGTLHAAYIDSNSHLSIASRRGTQWTSTVVKADSVSGRFASIGIDAARTIHVVHYDHTTGLTDSSRAANATQWVHTTILKSGSENRLVQGSDGTLHVVTTESQSGAMHYATLKPGGSWTVERIGNAGNYGLAALALDEKGSPHVSAWQWDAPGQGGKLVLADKASTWTVQPAGIATSYSTDLVVKDGTTHLVFATPSNGSYDGAMHYAKKPAGGVWSTPEKVNWAGWDPDLKLGSDGQPVVVASVEGYLQQSSRTETGEWKVSHVSTSQGNAMPFYVEGTNEIVFTNEWSGGFSIAAPKIAQ